MTDDALTIARWCWPGAADWREDAEVRGALFAAGGIDAGRYFDPESLFCVPQAERVLIKRGHADKYGAALAAQIGMHVIGAVGETFGPIVLNEPEMTESGYVEAKNVAAIATAPLDARIRAMAAVIRSLT